MTGSDGNINGPYFFYTSFNFSADIHGAQAPLQLNFISVFKDGNTCVGEVHVAKCTLVPAIVEQHVILVNKTLTRPMITPQTSSFNTLLARHKV